MNPKFKEGDKVNLRHDGKEYVGVVIVRDLNRISVKEEDFSYDVECKIGIIKHIPESELKLSK